ncbi:MAG: rod shape-determining protein RodA [Candidatus Omnitrophica bacterium]|nr:rod shape-determining protein RodA [Candidatus Omnitrophota bacterium]
MKILMIAILIGIIGIMSIYSSTYQNQIRLWRMQIIWLFLGIVSFLFFLHYDYRRFWDITYFLYVAVIILLWLVLILGSVRLGAQRWLRVAWFNLQPSELAKLIIVIFLSRYFSKKSALDIGLLSSKFGILRAIVIPFLFVAFPVGLIIEQPDLGSGVIMIVIFLGMLYLADIRLKYIFIFLFLIIFSLPFCWHFLRDYQKARLMVFLNPNADPLGAGYTLLQSKIAIGSGGFWGRGWLLGTQSQLRFLPESHTDFIFATFAEERGLLGSVALLILYYFLIREGLLIAQRTQEQFGRLLAGGISFMLGIQVSINIAMTMGLVPIVGLPLPLFSYGGSSMVVTFIALGILANIEKRRAVF